MVAAVVVSTFQDYGIGWDEELHVAYGEKLLAYYASGFRDRSAFSFINLYLYGGFFDLTAALANLVLPFGVYETRHLLGGVMMLAGLLGVWRLTRLLAGDRAAVIAVAAAATTPLLFGHSFINPKDAPLAWLSVWVAYFACRLFDHRGPQPLRLIFGLGLSLGLALGTRIIAFAFIAQIVVALGILIIAHRNSDDAATHARRAIRSFLMALLLAFGVMAVLWPWSVQAPFNVVVAFRELANLGWTPAMLWMGEMVQAPELPRSYFAVLFAVQLPEYVLAGVVAAVVFGLNGLRRARLSDLTTLRIVYVSLTVIVPLAVFAAVRPSTYNGVRHFLFLTPHIVVLAAIGLDRGIDFFTRAQPGLGVAFGGAVLLGILRQAAIMAELHPYQYLAFNGLTGDVSGAYGRFELDYWGVTYREAAQDLMAFLANDALPATDSAPHRLYVCGSHTSADYRLPPRMIITDNLSEADFYIGGDLSNPRCPGPGPEGRRIVEIARRGAVLSYVLDLRRAAGSTAP